jgi:8-oxo-dGTP pyrophosphatase MutT (NUDIX family)
LAGVDNQQPEVMSQGSWVSADDGVHDKTLFESWLLRLRLERFRSRTSGKTHDFYITYLADGVHVIALTRDRQLVMVRQFRAGSRRDSLETPGGLLEPDEDPRVAGARELLEETGYAGDPAKLIGTLRPNPALLTMKISTIVVRNAQRIAEPRLDQSEELVIELIPIDEILALIVRGEIDHAVCVAGLLSWLMSGRTDHRGGQL